MTTRRAVLGKKAQSLLLLLAVLLVVFGVAILHVWPWAVALVAVIGLGLVFAQQRMAQTRQIAWRYMAGTLLYLLSGLGVGLLLPDLSVAFLPYGLALGITVFFAFGVVELRLLNSILASESDWCRFDGHRFPFLSLGIAIAVALKTQ